MTAPTPRTDFLSRSHDLGDLRESVWDLCRQIERDLAAALEENAKLRKHAEALRSELYRYADSVDNAAIRAFDEAMGAAVFGGGQPDATSGNPTTHSGKSVQATHSHECPDHEQKPPQPAHPKEGA